MIICIYSPRHPENMKVYKTAHTPLTIKLQQVYTHIRTNASENTEKKINWAHPCDFSDILHHRFSL